MTFKRKGIIEWILSDGKIARIVYDFTTMNYKDKYCKKLLKDMVIKETKKYYLRKEL